MSKKICIFCESKFDEDELFSYNKHNRCPVCGEVDCFLNAREEKIQVPLTNVNESN